MPAPSSLVQRCSRCDAENAGTARFCGQCGASLASPCPACSAPTTPEQRFCNACGHDLRGRAAAPPGSAAPGPVDDGERRHATVMFSDLAGYTALNEARDPEEVEALMNRIKTEATAVIEGHGGTVNQFVGDEIMALFGVPVAHRDDPRRAVAAALDLHHAVDALLAGTPAGSPRLALHTGINTGLVIARRSDGRAGDYTLTGDTVNTAARLRSVAAPGEIVVGVDTWQQVSDAFEGKAGAPVEVKGKERALVAWRILGPKATVAAGERSLIGRDEELGEFAVLAAACIERKRGRVLIVRGDPGVGKSRLVIEFARLAQARGYACHAAAVLDFGAETGRDAVRSLARSLLGLAPNADEANRRDAAERATAARALGPDQRLFLHDLVDVAPPPAIRALADAMSTAAREKGSLRALCELVRSRAGETPLLLVVEDIHWADAWTLERLAALATLATRHPFLLVMTTRFAGDPTAGAWRTAVHGAPLVGLDLGPLTAEETARLATAASGMPPEVIRSCVERAEGNPLFLLQLLLAAGEAAQTDLPGSIQALVHTRMDRLAPADKAALQAAAVLGQRFAPDALRHLVESPDYDCRLLVEHFLVRREGDEFLFCHALIRDGAYASLLHTRRRRLHARAAGWYAAFDLALAAEHYDRAGHPEAARTYLAACQGLMAQQRHASALALAERGLQLAGERETRFALLMARSRLLVELGRAGDAIEAARTALEFTVEASERALALIAMAAGMRLNERITEGLAALDEAEPLAEAAGLRLELSRLHHLRGNLCFPLGRAAECLHAHERALAEARAAASLEAEAAALGGLGDAHYLHGRMRSACEQFQACVALARRHGFGRLEVANMPMVGWSLHHLNGTAASIDIGHQAIELATRAEQPRAQLLGRGLVVWVDGLIRGRIDHAEDHAAHAHRLIEHLGARRFEAQLRGCAAVFAWRVGDRARALEQAQTALAICRTHGMGHIGPWVLGVCALVEPDPDARRRWIAEGEAQLERGCVSHNFMSLRDLEIEVFLELGDWEAVDAACARLAAYTAAEPLPLSELRIARGLALSRHGRGERSEALRAELARARDSAAAAEVNVALPALDRALAGYGATAMA